MNNCVKERYSNIQLEYKSINTLLKDFKKRYKYDTEIQTVRKKTAGHIDRDFCVYFDTIKKLDGELMGQMIGDFLFFLDKLYELAFKILTTENENLENKKDILLDKLNKVKFILENQQLPPILP